MSILSKKQGSLSHKPLALYDKYLIATVIALLLIGLMMVASSSVMVSTKLYHQPFHFLIRQLCYLCVGVFVAVICGRINMK